MGKALLKIVLTKSGESTLTYDIDTTTNRIITLSHIEQEWSQTAQLLVDDRDNNLTALDIWGYQGIISYGYNDDVQGDEFSAAAPLYVIGQKTDTIFRPNGDLLTRLSLAGVFNLMGEDHASEIYAPDRLNTDTVKTILTAIATSTLTAFSHTKAWTITYDSEDSLIDSFIPADAFSVAFNESRLSAFRKLLNFTKSKARIEDDGEIHIFNPTVSGGTYDYEYDDIDLVTNHNFFNKSVRKRVVIPGKVTVSTHPDHAGASFTGSAQDDDYTNNPVELQIPIYRYLRITSNAEGVSIATAILQGYQLSSEKGHGIVPMNVGQEVMDFIKITDSAASDSRTGNIGYLQRNYSAGRFECELRFGTLLLPGLAGTLPPRASEGGDGRISIEQFIELWNYVNQLQENILILAEFVVAQRERTEFTHLSVTERFQGPMGPNMFT